jgi:hypothetical protein
VQPADEAVEWAPALGEEEKLRQAAGEGSRRKAREAASYAQKAQGERARFVRRLL